MTVPVQTAVVVALASGTLTKEVAVHVFETGSYLPPVFVWSTAVSPAQMIMLLPVHTAAWFLRPAGAPTVDVAAHVSMAGSYRAPVLVDPPPQMIIRLPVHTAECPNRAVGAPAVVVVSHESFEGSYRPPVFTGVVFTRPPQTTSLLLVQTPVASLLPGGALTVEVGSQVSLAGE